ncbi:hypothetical protein BpJC7_00520 [Weizmannia acidilactici]|uniref:Uncharacterized protein n=1 Tax=Weizmannia acidilactici TaxID=2607726 RepID=A0A5J4JBX8_9BACI|nr:hypothetical protein [Weizmannia acidilactici]GER67450.1 hypothetical protein BpJC4_19210 [Weizmannia acidilactici]GER68749.1 hypothetical protein BpJC7_00520 [Weizmannia acidilactici]
MGVEKISIGIEKGVVPKVSITAAEGHTFLDPTQFGEFYKTSAGKACQAGSPPPSEFCHHEQQLRNKIGETSGKISGITK